MRKPRDITVHLLQQAGLVLGHMLQALHMCFDYTVRAVLHRIRLAVLRRFVAGVAQHHIYVFFGGQVAIIGTPQAEAQWAGEP